jgi:inorganic pyrophosphatase
MPDTTLDVIIEIPAGSRNKYEYDHASHVIRLDRVLHSSVHYPSDYGFIPDTLSKDGDPLDVLVLVIDPTFPGCHVPARPVGLLRMHDEKGEDEKVLAVPVGDPRFEEIDSLEDVPAHWLREIENFFATYKLLEDKETDLYGWEGRDKALETIEDSRNRYSETQRQGSADLH